MHKEYCAGSKIIPLFLCILAAGENHGAGISATLDVIF